MMIKSENFTTELEKSIRLQFKSKNVGYLLGAGASYLDGSGYPLALTIWDRIKNDIPQPEQEEIQTKLNMDGTEGLEHALDLLDPGGPEPTPHRNFVIEAIAKLFYQIDPPVNNHCEFLKRIVRRNDNFVPIFTLNYDPLIELASDEEQMTIIDGFSGFYKASFDQNNFDLIPSKYSNSRKGRILSGNNGILHLYKLHGSIGWFLANNRPLRVGLSFKEEDSWRRLMIPPQYRKATETTTQPYSALWTRFRAWAVHGPRPLNRLVCIGYGMRDQHVNDVIENAASRNDFTLLIFAKELTDECFQLWARKENVIIVTTDRCSLYGQKGTGHDILWNFAKLCKEV